MMSASARPLFALRSFILLRQVVMSGVDIRVVRMVWMSDGWGAAMHSYMVSLVIISLFIDEGSGFGWPLMWRGVPGNVDSVCIFDEWIQ